MAIHCAAVRTQVFLWRHLLNELAIGLIAIQLQRGNALAVRGTFYAEIIGNLTRLINASFLSLKMRANN
jgi:hypothetical protein